PTTRGEFGSYARRTEMNTAVVNHEEWLAARKQFLAKEKEFTRLRDELSRQRRALPREEVKKRYVFDGPAGKQTLAELFDGNSQLIVYHFMFGPGWDEGCPGCSFIGDHLDGAVTHVNQRDIALVAVSRPPRAEFEPFRKRMGWRFKWLSSAGSDFNFDYHVSFTKEDVEMGKLDYNYGGEAQPREELPGASVFYKDDGGRIFHTYSTYARGLDLLLGAYNWIDLTPKGRDEEELSFPMAWVRHHDRYGQKASQSWAEIAKPAECGCEK